MFELKIHTDNAAFEGEGFANARGAEEVARILRLVADKLQSGTFDHQSPGKWQNVKDLNGNTCGNARLSAEG